MGRHGRSKLSFKCLIFKFAALLTCVAVVVASVVLLFLYVPLLVKELTGLEILYEFCWSYEIVFLLVVCSSQLDGIISLTYRAGLSQDFLALSMFG